MMLNTKKNIQRAVLVSCAAFLAFAAIAVAAPTKDEYKDLVEPICKTNKEASDRILKPVRGLVKNDKLKDASTRFKQAAAALEKAYKQLSLVEQPPEDAAKLGKWLSGIKGEVSLMKTISAKFGQGNKSKGSSLVVKLTNNANATNNLVIAYQFDYCKIDPSKYT